jgi:hypothetical protein
LTDTLRGRGVVVSHAAALFFAAFYASDIHYSGLAKKLILDKKQAKSVFFSIRCWLKL